MVIRAGLYIYIGITINNDLSRFPPKIDSTRGASRVGVALLLEKEKKYTLHHPAIANMNDRDPSKIPC